MVKIPHEIVLIHMTNILLQHPKHMLGNVNSAAVAFFYHGHRINNSIAQRATKAAVEANPSQIKYMVDAFHKRRDLVFGLMKEIPGFKLNNPDGAFYVFPDVSDYFGKTLRGTEIKDATDFAMYLLAEANVATVTGDAFGSPNCLRLSYATSEEQLIEAIKRIKDAVS